MPRRRPRVPRPLRPGAVLAPGLRVVGHLRRGEDADVYDAFSDVRRSRCVAKTPRQDRCSVPAVRRALTREGRLLLGLTHPNIVRAYELVREGPVLVLETLGGVTLSRLFDERPRLGAGDVAELGRQLASAVGYLHRSGVLHLDLKPSNVIAEAGRARIIDLGIARSPGRVRAGLGTPGFMSPEQAAGHAVGPPADVWGIGVLLHMAATGASPAAGSRIAPTRTRRRLPAGLADAIDAALDPDPAMRPSIGDIEAAVGGPAHAPVSVGA